jgi:hypothetical protein
VDSINNFAPGEQLRTEVFVTFGNAGPRGGSGASAPNIDINGNGTIDTDEANVRTVPTRIGKPLPALQICNDYVTIMDTFSTGTATVSLLVDQIGSGVSTNSSQTYTLTGTVGGSGTLANTAELTGTGSTVTLTTGTNPVTGLPITATRDCCVAVDLTANSNVLVATPPPPTFCSYGLHDFDKYATGAPATLLVNNFATYFPGPTGLLIGTQPSFYANWTILTALRSFLANAGAIGPLTANTTNALSTSGGQLATQTATLTINLTLSPLYPDPGIGNLILTGTGTVLDGYTVSQILSVANTALGGGGLPTGFTFGTLTHLLASLNTSWENCTQSAFAVAKLK